MVVLLTSDLTSIARDRSDQPHHSKEDNNKRVKRPPLQININYIKNKSTFSPSNSRSSILPIRLNLLRIHLGDITRERPNDPSLDFKLINLVLSSLNNLRNASFQSMFHNRSDNPSRDPKGTILLQQPIETRSLEGIKEGYTLSDSLMVDKSPEAEQGPWSLD